MSIDDTRSDDALPRTYFVPRGATLARETARSADDGGGFSDGLYQRLTDDQLTMVLALTNNTDGWTIPKVSVPRSVEKVNLTELTGEVEAHSVEWMVKGLCDLWVQNNGHIDEQDRTSLEREIESLIRGSLLPDMDQAWVFTINGTVIFNGSNLDIPIEDLPEDRWASTSDHTKTERVGEVERTVYSATLRYFLWLP